MCQNFEHISYLNQAIPLKNIRYVRSLAMFRCGVLPLRIETGRNTEENRYRKEYVTCVT